MNRQLHFKEVQSHKLHNNGFKVEIILTHNRYN